MEVAVVVDALDVHLVRTRCAAAVVVTVVPVGPNGCIPGRNTAAAAVVTDRCKVSGTPAEGRRHHHHQSVAVDVVGHSTVAAVRVLHLAATGGGSGNPVAVVAAAVGVVAVPY